jgi:lipopolysaccharide assembly outer membrane protein LptD (OstA)
VRSAGLLLVLLLLLPLPAEALQEDDLPVRVTADVFRYDRRTRVLTATGNVVLTAADVVIKADSLVANLGTGDVTAGGGVTLESAGQTVRGMILTYNLNTRIGTLYEADTTYTGPMVLGPVTLRAARLEGDPARFAAAEDAFATTCDPENPLVWMTARELAVIVGDKIVGRQVSIWLGDRRLFTLPYFIIFLQERRESRIAPVVGYSDAEGWFLKTAYSY